MILRKAYGLGAQAMAAGSLHEPLLTVGWPTAELGPMGLEGAVRLGFRRELEEIADEDEREARVAAMVEAAHEHAKALNAATLFELDDVVDPADTRRLIAATIAAAPARARAATAPGSSTPGSRGRAQASAGSTAAISAVTASRLRSRWRSISAGASSTPPTPLARLSTMQSAA